MEEKFYRLLKWSNKEAMPPYSIQLHLTNFCNLNCSFCPTKSMVKETDRKIELSKDKMMGLIEESSLMGVKEWHICGGGEPLYFREPAIEVMEEIKKKSMKGELITNGTLFDEKLVEKVVEIGWDKIDFSLDSPDEETNDLLRSKASFKKVIKTVRLFSKYKKILKKSKPYIGFHTVLCNKNYKQVPWLVKLAKEVGCQEMLITTLNVWNNPTKKLMLSKKQVVESKKYLRESDKLANKLSIKTNIREFLDPPLLENANEMKKVYSFKKQENKAYFSPYCLTPWFNMSIFSDGTAQPCYLLKKSELNCKEMSLGNIWHSPHFNKIREVSLKRKVNNRCKRCNSYNVADNQKLNENLIKYNNKVNLWDTIRVQKSEVGYLESRIKDLKKESVTEQECLKSRIKDLKKESVTEQECLKSKIEQLEKNVMIKDEELNRLYNSISFKLGSKLGNNAAGKFIKRIVRKTY